MNLKKFMTYSETLAYVELNKATFTKLYRTKNLTARNVAENQNIFYDQNFQKALLRVCGSKGLGLGGSRIGSGNKKGRYCGKCRQLKPCECEKLKET